MSKRSARISVAKAMMKKEVEARYPNEIVENEYELVPTGWVAFTEESEYFDDLCDKLEAQMPIEKKEVTK